VTVPTVERGLCDVAFCSMEIAGDRLLHQLQELARVRRQRLDVAALPFGVERVEGERALARAGQPGDDDQPMARQVEIDVLEVVRARTADADVFHDVRIRACSHFGRNRERGVGGPIRAPEAAQTGRPREEGNAQWRPKPPVPFGLLPKTPIAALQSLAGQAARLRLRALR
jgi:hypothetical protein